MFSNYKTRAGLACVSVAGLYAFDRVSNPKQGFNQRLLTFRSDGSSEAPQTTLGKLLGSLSSNQVFSNFSYRPALSQISSGCERDATCAQKDWPVYRRQDVQRQARETKKVWVTYKEGVYDLTEFAVNHPGGADKLLMARGGPIEPFWEQYPFHKEEQI